jgi:hypothetical protein
MDYNKKLFPDSQSIRWSFYREAKDVVCPPSLLLVDLQQQKTCNNDHKVGEILK